MKNDFIFTIAGYLSMVGAIIWWIINMIIHWNDPISFSMLWHMSWPPALLFAAGWTTLFIIEDPTLP